MPFDISLSRCVLYIEIYALRLGGIIAFWMMNRLWQPYAPGPDRSLTIEVDMTDYLPFASYEGRERHWTVRLQIYDPPASLQQYPTPLQPLLDPQPDPAQSGRKPIWDPAQKLKTVIHFHGGAYTIGSTTNDERYFLSLTRDFGARVISASYPRAPEHPLPAAIEAAAGVIRWVLEHADELGVDEERVWLSGKSAGADAAIAALALLRDPEGMGCRRAKREGVREQDAHARVEGGDGVGGGDRGDAKQVRGILAFYPVLDWSSPRWEHQPMVQKADRDLPRWMIDIFAAALAPPPRPPSPRTSSPAINEAQSAPLGLRESSARIPQSVSPPGRRIATCLAPPVSEESEPKPGLNSTLHPAHPLISPYFLPSSTLAVMPPMWLLVPAYDPSGPSVLRLASRARAFGVHAMTWVVEGVGHGWDKPPFFRSRQSVRIAYGRAVGWLWDQELGQMVESEEEGKEWKR